MVGEGEESFSDSIEFIPRAVLLSNSCYQDKGIGCCANFLFLALDEGFVGQG